jgi:TDG/mug DNA glycosylase family protein
VLPDYLAPGLDLVFVGYNPGERSARLGHYYAGINNAFWPLLFDSGLVADTLTFEDDARILQYGIGLTDLVKRSSRSSADLRPQEVREGGDEVRRKLLAYQPRLACFNGKGIFERVFGRACQLGPQPECIGGTATFVVPSTSARNGRLRRSEKLAYFQELRLCLQQLKAA